MANVMRQTPVTLEEVAREAGVSRATASRAFNGSVRNVREESRQRVLTAAMRLGYYPNAAAQAVARGRTNTIALVVNGIADDYLSPIASGVLGAADRMGLMATMQSARNSTAGAIEVVSALRAQRPRAIVMAGGRNRHDPAEARLVEELQAYEREGGRAIVISQAGMPFDTVEMDNVSGAAELGETLCGLGYRDFAIVAGPESANTAQDRVRGFTTALSRHGVSVRNSNIIHCDFSRDGGYAAAGDLLTRRLPAQVVFAISDAIAVGVIARFREAGVELPGRIAVAGFDDVRALRDVTPALTTVSLPWNEAGSRALELALTDREGPPSVITLSGHVVARASTPVVIDADGAEAARV